MKYIGFKKDNEFCLFHSTDDDSLEPNFKKYHPDIADYVVCNDLKQYDDFALCHDIENGKKIFKMDLAKGQTKQRLRGERKSLLQEQDIKFMQAQESGADTTAIVAEKQRLRDITKEVDSCKTTDELKALKCEAS